MTEGDHQPVTDQICSLRMNAMAARMDGMDEALRLKEKETERRLEGLNELRGDYVKDRDQFVRKDIFYQQADSQNKQHEDIGKRIGAHESRITIIETRSVVWAAALALFFAVVQIALHFWTKATP